VLPAAVEVPATVEVVPAAVDVDTEDEDAVPGELLLHDAVTSIAAQPAAIAALCVQRIWSGSFRYVLRLTVTWLVISAIRVPATLSSVVDR